MKDCQSRRNFQNCQIEKVRGSSIKGQATKKLQCFQQAKEAMSRKPAIIKIVNLEDGMPRVEQARLRMQHELAVARTHGIVAVKLIHGYGSSGAGGALRNELQKELRRASAAKSVACFIAGEDWTISDETTWSLLKKYPEWKHDSDLGRGNKGISIVVL
jgi:hypothetical protein